MSISKLILEFDWEFFWWWVVLLQLSIFILFPIFSIVILLPNKCHRIIFWTLIVDLHQTYIFQIHYFLFIRSVVHSISFCIHLSCFPYIQLFSIWVIWQIFLILFHLKMLDKDNFDLLTFNPCFCYFGNALRFSRYISNELVILSHLH